MYARNAASPDRLAIGAVVQISDGAVQTSGCTVRVLPLGGAEGDGGGTTAYSTDGVVLYTPTQAETNYASFVLIAKKTGCIPASITVVTTDSPTTGRVNVSHVAGTSQTAGDIIGDTNDIQSRLPAALVSGRMDSSIGAVASGVIAAASFAAGALDAVWSTATRLLTAGTNIALAKGTGVTGFNDLDAVGVRTAVGLVSANLDTQLADLPTNGELATALAAADDATLAAIAALNNLSSAQAQTAAAAALTAYDPPTKSELDAAVSPLATATALGDVPTNSELATALAAADDAVLAAIAALNNLSAATVKSQVVAALATDTYAEPAAVPAATATLAAKLGWLTILARNVVTQTATTQTVKADDGTTDVATAAVSDTGSEFTRAEWT